MAWPYPGGDEAKPVNGTDLQAPTAWRNGDAVDPTLRRVPYQNLLTGSGLVDGEADRRRAIEAMKIPQTAP